MLALFLSITALAVTDACPDPSTLGELAKCKGRPTKVIPSKESQFEFVYYRTGDSFEEYVWDKKKNKICGMTVVREMKDASDKAECFPCKNGEC